MADFFPVLCRIQMLRLFDQRFLSGFVLLFRLIDYVPNCLLCGLIFLLDLADYCAATLLETLHCAFPPRHFVVRFACDAARTSTLYSDWSTIPDERCSGIRGCLFERSRAVLRR